MIIPTRPAVVRRLLFACRIAAIAAAIVIFLPFQSGAADREILVELNNAQTVAGACHASFSLRNGLAHTLDRFQLDLHVLSGNETLRARTKLDLAPLENGKTTTFTFRILAEPCDRVSKVLVNDIPMCRADDGTALDCMARLAVKSRHRIGLAQ